MVAAFQGMHAPYAGSLPQSVPFSFAFSLSRLTKQAPSPAGRSLRNSGAPPGDNTPSPCCPCSNTDPGHAERTRMGEWFISSMDQEGRGVARHRGVLERDRRVRHTPASRAMAIPPGLPPTCGITPSRPWLTMQATRLCPCLLHAQTPLVRLVGLSWRETLSEALTFPTYVPCALPTIKPKTAAKAVAAIAPRFIAPRAYARIGCVDRLTSRRA